MLPPVVLDEIQLERIRATHKGFLYQHLYAVGCLLLAPATDVRTISVERDEDIELVDGTGRVYLQVKMRSVPLMPSDVKGALERFDDLRAAHARGEREGAPTFFIVANIGPGPALAEAMRKPSWPSDVTLLWAAGRESPHPALPSPWGSIPEAITACAELAGRYRLSSLKPETIVWKLAGLITAASTGETRSGTHTFRSDEIVSLCEVIAAQLNPFPVVEDYRSQVDEPDLVAGARVRLILGHQGAGKSAWAGQAALHSAALPVYFDLSDAVGVEIAARVVREACAHASQNGGIEAGKILLPGATGLEALSALDAHAKANNSDVLIVLDNVHRGAAEELVRMVERTRYIRWVLLARPGAEASRLATRLGITTESLQGWDENTVASVLHESGCRLVPADAIALRCLTGGAPLFVRSAASVIASNYSGDVATYVADVKSQLHAEHTAQEVLLADTFERLTQATRRLAAALTFIETPLQYEEWETVLERAIELGGTATCGFSAGTVQCSCP